MPEFLQFSSLVHALGWMIIHFVWQGCVIAGAYWLLCRLAKPERSGLRYLAGLGAYLASAMVPALTLAYYLRPAPGMLTTAELTLPTITVATGYRLSGWQFIQQGLEPSLPLIVVLWAAGVTFLSSRTVMGWLGTRRLVTTGTAAVGHEVMGIVERLRLRMGVGKVVTVLRSTRVAVPTLVGWLRPVVLLPASVIAQLPREQLEMIIAHELAHVRRNDYLVNLLQLVIETLFFYHPAIRWMSKQVREERELCCDDLVVARCGKPVVYARALASLEALRETKEAQPALAATGGDLFHRVSRIVRRELPRKNSGFVQVALVAAMAAVAGISAQRGIELARVPAMAEQATVAPVSEPAPDYSARTSLGVGLQLHGAAERRAQAERLAAIDRARLEQDRLRAAQRPAPASGTQNTFRAQPPLKEMQVELETLPAPHTAIEVASIDPLPAVPEPEPTARAVVTVAPDYPKRAYRDGVEGFVKLQFRITDRGRADDIQVVDAHPADTFDTAAIRALKRWEFEVEPGHDPALALLQTFDFAMLEDDETASRRGLRCRRTGSRICTHDYSEEQVSDYWEARKSK